MELLTYAEAKVSRELANVSGVCGGSDDFRSLLNQATRKLMRRGSFWGTVQKIRVCAYGCHVAWPRFVGTPLAINLNGHHSPIKNGWYEFLPMQKCDFGMDGIWPWVRGSFARPPITDNGVSPVFNPIACGHPVYIRVYPSVRADIGKTVTLYGLDSNGQAVRTKDANGNWREGEVLTLAIPYTQSTILYREINRISKAVTQGVVRYFQWQPIGDYTYNLVSHEPDETEPVYRVSRFSNSRNCCLKSIKALIKLEFIPVKTDTDLVQISNLDALSDMIRSIREKNAGNIIAADSNELSAVRELNLELRNRTPNDQITTHVEYFASPMPRTIM